MRRLLHTIILIFTSSICLIGCQTEKLYEEQSTLIIAVDLGLPSGLKWASCNVYAARSEKPGTYFQWGVDDVSYAYYFFSYKWFNSSGDNYTIIKYNYDSKFGTVDNKMVLDAQDDVANVVWGKGWYIPSTQDWQELSAECNWSWEDNDYVSGFKVTGPNGKSIFLPAGGYFKGIKESGSTVTYDGIKGFYWTCDLNEEDPSCAQAVTIYESNTTAGYVMEISGCERYIGLSVRPVID